MATVTIRTSYHFVLLKRPQCLVFVIQKTLFFYFFMYIDQQLKLMVFNLLLFSLSPFPLALNSDLVVLVRTC
jgi:hypothetical protein